MVSIQVHSKASLLPKKSCYRISLVQSELFDKNYSKNTIFFVVYYKHCAQILLQLSIQHSAEYYEGELNCDLTPSMLSCKTHVGPPILVFTV